MGLLTGQNATKYSQYTADQFTGNGSQTIFTLSRVPVTTSSLMVSIDGVKQHSTTYTLNAGTIVFTEAPPNGSAIECIAIGSQGVSIVPADGTVGTLAIIDSAITTSKVANGSITAAKHDVGNGDGTGSLTLPNGSTAQRPSSPKVGDIRWNSQNFSLELWDSSQWYSIKSQFAATGGTMITSAGFVYHVFTSSDTFTVTRGSTTVKVLLVAGGGAGGWDVGGGGGAGGVLLQDYTPVVGSYPILIGAGATASTSGGGNAPSGANTTVFGYTAVGGGGAGNWQSGAGMPGGSGGGCTSNLSNNNAGTVGQGYASGYGGGNTSNANEYSGAAGGGGAGGTGGNGVSSGWTAASTTYGYGGAGRSDTTLEGILSATSKGILEGDGIRYIGGGGGSASDGQSYWGIGGKGGGGRGGAQQHAAANTGGGGGGAGTTPNIGGNGGSGLVIIRYQI